METFSLSHPSCSVQFLDFYIACRPSPDRCRLQREDGGRRWEERKKNCRYLLLLCLRERGRKLQREERRRRKREREKYLLPSFLGDATHLFFSVSHLAILPPSLQSLAFIPVLITVPRAAKDDMARQMRKKMCRGPPSPPPAHDATGRGDTPLLLLHGKKHDFPSSWHVRGFPILAPLFSPLPFLYGPADSE